MRWEEKDIDIQTKFQYIKSMINDMTLVGEVMMKIVSGMLFNVEGAIVVGLFIVGAFVIKYKLEQN